MSFLDDVLATNKIQYTECCAKILAILQGAQEHQLNDGQIDQRVKNAELATLYELKATLANEIAAAEGCSDEASFVY